MPRAVVLALVLAACGDNLAALPFAELDAARVAAECSRLARCGLFTDEATCLAYFRARPDADLAAAIDSGKVLYNPRAAEACIADLAARGCDLTAPDGRALPDSCARMFTGTLDLGEPCAFDAECVSSSCDAPACPRNMCCLGTCASTIPDGECNRDADCGPDRFCDAPAHTCHALADVGAECTADTQCAYGLGCIGATDLQPGNCRALPHLGERCPYQRCADLGTVCTNGTCVAVGLPGSPCITGADCSPYAHCAADTQTCANIPVLGEPCNGSCAGEAYCDLETRLCTMPKPNDQPCSASDQCESLYCEEGPFFDQCSTPVLCT
jgi:hypothetical protein